MTKIRSWVYGDQDWGLGLGLWLRIGYWGFRLRIWIRDWKLGLWMADLESWIGIGDWK